MNQDGTRNNRTFGGSIRRRHRPSSSSLFEAHIRQCSGSCPGSSEEGPLSCLPLSTRIKTVKIGRHRYKHCPTTIIGLDLDPYFVAAAASTLIWLSTCPADVFRLEVFWPRRPRPPLLMRLHHCLLAAAEPRPRRRSLSILHNHRKKKKEKKGTPSTTPPTAPSSTTRPAWHAGNRRGYARGVMNREKEREREGGEGKQQRQYTWRTCSTTTTQR